MPQFVVRFVGKISWEGRMNGLPDEIFAFLIFNETNPQIINDAIEKQGKFFVEAQGMSVQKDQGSPIDMRQTPSDRIFVPMRWIVSIQTQGYTLHNELSIADGTGKERLSDGSEPVKH